MCTDYSFAPSDYLICAHKILIPWKWIAVAIMLALGAEVSGCLVSWDSYGGATTVTNLGVFVCLNNQNLSPDNLPGSVKESLGLS